MASSETQRRDTRSSQIVFALVPLNELRRPPPKTNKKAHFFSLQVTRISDRYMGTGHSKLPWSRPGGKLRNYVSESGGLRGSDCADSW